MWTLGLPPRLSASAVKSVPKTGLLEPAVRSSLVLGLLVLGYSPKPYRAGLSDCNPSFTNP